LLRLNSAAEANGTPLSLRMFDWQAALPKKPLKYCESVLFFGRRKRFTDEQKTTGLVGNRQRIAILAIPEQELALAVGASLRQRRAMRPTTQRPRRLTTVAIEHCMPLADFRRTPGVPAYLKRGALKAFLPAGFLAAAEP
jgi:hypothetical protein